MRETVLLFGATGLLARDLLPALARAGHPVLAVVRKASRPAARARLAALRAVDPVAAGRITLLTGDIARPAVLDGGDLPRVAEASVVVHAAAFTDPAAGRALAFEQQVGGTENVLTLARALPRLRRLVYVSDARVSGDRVGRFGEEELFAGQDLGAPLVVAKAVAERRVRGSGLDAVILRPASLVDADPPRLTPLDRWLDVYLRLPTRLLPWGDAARVDVVPLGWVAAAAVAAVDAPAGTWHLCDPDPPTVRAWAAMVDAQLGRAGPRLALGPTASSLAVRAPPVRALRTLLDHAWNVPTETLLAPATRARRDPAQAAAALAPLGLFPPPAPGAILAARVAAARARRPR